MVYNNLVTIYFTASIVGKKHFLKNYLTIVDLLKTNNGKVISDHIINSSENKLIMETREERIKFQEQLDKWINSSDCVVAEVSFPSISVGYEISLALNRGKPVLILYTNSHPPSLLAHHKNEKLVCEKYNPNNAGDIIEDFLNYVKGTEDSRFTFYISSEIASYLDKVSRKNKVPKAVYLRKIIEKDMRDNK